jgi:hypothetical protein
VAVLGFALGVAVGRWGALVTGVVFAIWIGIGTQADEAPVRDLVLRYGAVAAAAVAAGVVLRRRAAR